MITNFDKLCGDLEKQELEAPNGLATPSIYAQLLAIYLYQNDLCNAKFLWKRIPQNIASSNPEIAAIWAIGQKLWKKDHAGTYQALAAYNWTEPIANIVRALEAYSKPLLNIGLSKKQLAKPNMHLMTGLSILIMLGNQVGEHTAKILTLDTLLLITSLWDLGLINSNGFSAVESLLVGCTMCRSERIRERAFNLIGRSYSSITLDTVVSMTGLSNEAIQQICKERKWEVSDDGATVKPIPPVQPAPLHTSSEDQLFKLTEFVSFLEN